MLDREGLLDAIYASVFDDAALGEALHGLAGVCASPSAGVFRLGASGLDWELNDGMPPGFMGEFAHWTARDPRVVHALTQPALTLLDDSAPDMRRAMQESGVDALARSWGLPYTAASVCAFEADAAWALYISRDTSRGPADGVARDGFMHYAGHFSRALRLRIQARHRMQARRNPLSAAPRMACLLVDGNARVRELPSDAAAMLRRADGVLVRRGVLVLACPRATASLHHWLGYLATAKYPFAVPLSLDVPQRHPPGVLKLRLAAMPPERGVRGRHLLAVWLESRDLPHRGAMPERPTPRQTQILRLLAEGHATAAIALYCGIAEATVRTHVKNLLALTGTRNRRACIAAACERGWL